ncbi:WD40-repeat-containing domain protein [Scleroderma citrinum]
MEKRRRGRVKARIWHDSAPGKHGNFGVSSASASMPSVHRGRNATRPFWDSTLDAQFFPEHLEVFATDVVAFLNCLNEFPEFKDEAVNTSIRAFEGDLKYWACCLRTYRGQFKYPAIQRYIHDLISETGEHIDRITNTLRMFIEVGVPTIRYAQKHAASNLLTLSTVATFFSAVTATTLQLSYPETSTLLDKSVNAFWFSSLVFSIAAAVNSLLGLSWEMAMYRSPGHRVPWWVLIWIKRSPLVFLVMSVACFSAGLVLFTYASGQAKITSIITTVFTAFTSFGLAAVSAWFLSERWIFLKYRGQKWLDDLLWERWQSVLEFWEEVMATRPFMWVAWPFALLWRGISWFYVGLQITGELVWKGLRTQAEHIPQVGNVPADIPSFEIDGETSGSSASIPVRPLLRSRPPSTWQVPRADLRDPLDVKGASSFIDSSQGQLSPSSYTVSTLLSANQGRGQPNTPISPRDRFAQAVRTVIILQSFQSRSPLSPNGEQMTSDLGSSSAVTDSASPLSPSGSSSATLNAVFSVKANRQGSEVVNNIRGSRFAHLIPKLKTLQPTQDLMAHSALVRYLEFSPNGKFLATSSWDRTSAIFRVGPQFETHRILAHVHGFVSQVAWSPSGHLLLTKINRVVKVWTEEGVCRRSIDRKSTIQAIAWLPGGDAFLSVEGSRVVKLDLNGKVLDNYSFNRVSIHDVAITPDSVRLLCVGPILSSPAGLHPSKSRVEKQLLVYNMETKQVENQTPVLNDVWDIMLSRDGLFALISYERKAPPQLWKLEMVRDRMDNTNAVVRLALRHTYMPKVPVDFAGHSSFGGKNDHLVLCASKAGDIYIWDRDSAVLLHHISDQALDGNLTCIAWNGAVDNVFTFATGSHDGSVRVWTTMPPEQPRACTAAPTPPTMTQPLFMDCHNSYERRANASIGVEGITARSFCRSPEPSEEDVATPLAF